MNQVVHASGTITPAATAAGAAATTTTAAAWAAAQPAAGEAGSRLGHKHLLFDQMLLRIQKGGA